MLTSRIAPTPSGYLHVGNAYNMVLTWLMVRQVGGRLRLRIDDLDQARVRPHYLEDVFDTLDWLGLTWDEGPFGVGEHIQHFSQRHRIPQYLEAIEQLIHAKAEVFSCTCSRKQILALDPTGLYAGTCYGQAPQWREGHTCLRLHTPTGHLISWQDGHMGLLQLDISQVMRDAVIRRKDGLPAYQIASVVDDALYGVNAIVRGEDLIPSTAIQLYIDSLLPQGALSRVRWYHHPLMRDAAGQKLSKSDGDMSLQYWRRNHAPGEFYQWLSLQLEVEPCTSLEALQRQWNHK